MRTAAIRLTSSLSKKPDCIKKKVVQLENPGLNIPAPTLPLKIPPIDKNTEF
jgi:hypothetical protein